MVSAVYERMVQETFSESTLCYLEWISPRRKLPAITL
jgi:hypothetical protein